MSDLSTKAGVLRFAADKRDDMERCFHRLGRFESNGHSFAGYAFLTHEVRGPWRAVTGGFPEPQTGPKLERVMAAALTFPPAALTPGLQWQERTAAFGNCIRAFIRAGKGIGALVFHEAWMAQPMSVADYQATIAGYEYGEIGQRHDRREALYMRLEHMAAGVHSWMREIQREPTRLMPWQHTDMTGTEYADAEGRLTGLVDWRS